MMKDLIFSFVIPAHDEEESIGKCLDSIKRQPEKNYEIVVVNDGSTDKTKEIAEEYEGVKLINFETGHSASFSRNRGAEKAEGKYLIFLDGDQILEDDFLKKLNLMVKEKDVNVAAFRVKSVKPKTIFQRGWHAYRKYNLCAAMIIKKEIFDTIKFNEKLFFIEDDVIFEDAAKRGYKLEESGAFVYHIDPKSLGDYFRQRKWQGRGLVLKIFRLGKFGAFRYFIPCLILPLAYFSIYIPIAYLLAFWIFFSVCSGEIINSFWWTVTDFIGRYISLFYFFKFSFDSFLNKILSKK